MRRVAAEAAAALERIWDLHDHLSDAILAASRARLLLPLPPPPAPSGGSGRSGRIFVKSGGDEAKATEAVAAAAAAAAAAADDTRSLLAIRFALEDLEGHLEFLHTIQSQQRAERDAAIARLEQSRLFLAMKLAEHQGDKYRVIDEALQFVGEGSDGSRFIPPEDVLAKHNQSGDNTEDNRGSGSRIVANVLSCSLSLAKKSFRLDNISGALGNAAVLAASMLAFVQLYQVASGSKTRAMGYSFQSGSSQQNGEGKHLEVSLTRG